MKKLSISIFLIILLIVLSPTSVYAHSNPGAGIFIIMAVFWSSLFVTLFLLIMSISLIIRSIIRAIRQNKTVVQKENENTLNPVQKKKRGWLNYIFLLIFIYSLIVMILVILPGIQEALIVPFIDAIISIILFIFW